MTTSAAILARFRRDHGRDINLTLRPAYRELLAGLGDPHRKLPPVFHVAGTNGKGSTCAFLRSILEASGYRVHIYTSPHLVRFHERIRVAGELIAEDELAEILGECEKLSIPGAISYFEAATAAAFTAFARHPADFTILEVGLGGRLDATNVIEKPLANLITRLSYDHCDYLGETLTQIAGEKAGIMRPGVPCFTVTQPDPESLTALRQAAHTVGCKLHVVDTQWNPALPPPVLIGRHQLENANLAMATLSVLSRPIASEALARGLQNAEWPARMQRLVKGALVDLMPQSWELWLDGGHNDSAGEILAAQAEAWRIQDGANPRTLHLVVGMRASKKPHEFLRPLALYADGLMAVTIPDEPESFLAEALALAAGESGIKNTTAENSVQQSITKIIQARLQPGRILICGSLYLAGEVLKQNAQ